MAEPHDREAMAGELALGVLDGEERAAALRLTLSDMDFAAAVNAWRTRLAPLASGFAEAPAPDLWPAIDARIEGAESPILGKLRFWRWAAIGSGAVAAGLAATLLLVPAPEPVTVVREIVRAPDQVAVAQLGGAAGTLVAANYDPGRGDLRVRPVALPESELTPELWVIPADGVPRSLGLVDARGTTRVRVPAKLRALIIDGATLAISMENPDGAPHEKPSSTPIATGQISKL